jgi:hypothetical protein
MEVTSILNLIKFKSVLKVFYQCYIRCSKNVFKILNNISHVCMYNGFIGIHSLNIIVSVGRGTDYTKRQFNEVIVIEL